MHIPNFIFSDEQVGDAAMVIIPDVRKRGLCALVVPKYAHAHEGVKLFFPGGKVKEGETPYYAAERELYDETNQHCRVLEPLFHQRKRGGHLKVWFMGHECSNDPLPHSPMDKSIKGKPKWYSLEALFTVDKKESRLHPDHWEALKAFLAVLVTRDVFRTYAEGILLKNEETTELALREGILTPERVFVSHV
ncbi:MAG: NUDIX domain-containing protein [Candidatus Paceibacterota bacterium]